MTQTFNDLEKAMKNCNQSKNETIWQHCNSVWEQYCYLLEDQSKLPPTIKDNFTQLVANQYPINIVQPYLCYHDCGKPYCITEKEGKVSFPNHVNISAKLFREAGGNILSAQLIELDMIFHLEKADDILAKNLESKTLATLMLSAWAAIFANAQMFGGEESESFKIKKSQLTSRCKKIIKETFI